jgi:hypothetical protein
MFIISVVCCQVEVSATSLSLDQRNLTDCGAPLCDIETSRLRRLWPAVGGSATGKIHRRITTVTKPSGHLFIMATVANAHR